MSISVGVKAYATGEFGEDHAEGVHLTIDNNDTVATTDFGVLEATNLQLVDTSHLDDVITLKNMAEFDAQEFPVAQTLLTPTTLKSMRSYTTTMVLLLSTSLMTTTNPALFVLMTASLKTSLD